MIDVMRWRHVLHVCVVLSVLCTLALAVPNQWQQLMPPDGRAPPRLRYGSLAHVHNSVYVYGGVGVDASTILSDLWELDLNDLTWRYVVANSTTHPNALVDHTLTPIDNTRYNHTHAHTHSQHSLKTHTPSTRT